jgi:hypothetical protein
MNNEERNLPGLNRMQQIGGAAAVLGIALCAVGLMTARTVFFQSYLFAAVFFTNLTLGCLGLVMFHHAIRANWSRPALRLWEAGARMVPVMFVLFLPVIAAVFLGQLYPWANAEQARTVPAIARKAGYLNAPFFTLRYLFYFLIWWFWASRLNNSSIRQDRTGDAREADKRANWAAPGIVVLILTVTLMCTDWVMSLDKEWHSTIFGFWFVVSQGLAASAFGTLALIWNARSKPFSEVMSQQVTRDLGNLILTFTMLWAYLSLSQWLIIYSGNLPDEIGFYVQRLNGVWWGLGTFVVVFQFFVPFVLLLSGRTKATYRYLAWVAGWILLMRALDVYWTVIPFFTQTPERAAAGGLHWLDLAAFLAVGGIWLAAYVGQLKKHALLPAHTPRAQEVQEALEHA